MAQHRHLTWWQKVLVFVKVAWEILTQRGKSRHLGSAARCCHPSVKGKTVIVTGPTSGIGLETAHELALAGAYVVLACRRLDAGKRLAQLWKTQAPDVTVEVRLLDLESLDSVRQFAEQWEQTHRPVHVLVNNAGIFNLGDNALRFTRDSYEQHMAVNYFSPLLLTLRMLPALARARGARIVNLNSIMHELDDLDVDDMNFKKHPSDYLPVFAYSRSKFAQVVMTNYLQRLLPSSLSIDVVAVHPGNALTEVARTIPWWLQILQRVLLSTILLTPSQGARSPLFCATDPSVAGNCASIRELKLLSGPYYDFECKPAQVSELAKDAELAKDLWQQTLKELQMPLEGLDAIISTMLGKQLS